MRRERIPADLYLYIGGLSRTLYFKGQVLATVQHEGWWNPASFLAKRMGVVTFIELEVFGCLLLWAVSVQYQLASLLLRSILLYLALHSFL